MKEDALPVERAPGGSGFCLSILLEIDKLLRLHMRDVKIQVLSP